MLLILVSWLEGGGCLGVQCVVGELLYCVYYCLCVFIMVVLLDGIQVVVCWDGDIGQLYEVFVLQCIGCQQFMDECYFDVGFSGGNYVGGVVECGYYGGFQWFQIGGVQLWNL